MGEKVTEQTKPPTEEASEDLEGKRKTPQAVFALDAYVNSVRESLNAAALRISVHEEVVRDDVHQAIAEMLTPKNTSSSLSDWLKWGGFFAIGLAVPLMISIMTSDKTDKSAVLWLVGSFAAGAVMIVVSAIFDFSTVKFTKKR